MTPDKILAIARGEIGTKESSPGNVKYNTAYYGRTVKGGRYAWCAVFVWWCFRQAGAPELYYGGKNTAYCPTLMTFHKAWAVVGSYQPGDVVFYNFSGGKNPQHVGICESWDGKFVTTIEGNTWTGNDTAGGRVMRRVRDKKYIVGAYRPAYEEDESVTYEQFKAYMEQYRRELGTQPAPDWGAAEMTQAVEKGITDGSRPMDLATRQEVVSMLVRAAK